jgi:hypothetical protein
MNQGYFGNAFVSARYKFNDGYTISLNAGYISGNLTLQSHSEGPFKSQCVVSKELLRKKATLTLIAANPYSKYLTFRTLTNGADFSQVSYNESYNRSFMVRLYYRLGRLNSEIKKNQHGINKDDLKGGDNNGSGN